MATDPFHDRLLKIVLTLPGAYEDRPWGSVHCKVAGKIFVGWSRHDDGEMGIGFRVDPEMQSMLVASDPRFTIAKYVGKYGGVDMRLGPRPNWDEVEQFIVESYRIIAPRKLVKELDARGGAAVKAVAGGRKVAAKTAKKSVATKTAAVKKAVAGGGKVVKKSVATRAAAVKKAAAPKEAAAKKTAAKKSPVKR